MDDDTTEFDFKEENVFGWIGLADNGDHYVAMSGLYDYFWALKPDARVKMVRGWIKGLESFVNPLFLDNVDEDPEGVLFVFKSDEIVEQKEPLDLPKGVVVPFKPRAK